MSFCKFSSESIISNKTTIDNLFINEFLPYADATFVKVYIYGLYKCNNADSFDNTLEDFSKILNLTHEQIEEAFEYWQEEGLVQILHTTSFEVRYLPLHNIVNNSKKFKVDKYTDFNLQAQEILTGRMITSNEYVEYYTFLECFHAEQTALLLIMEYCVKLKGEKVGYAYILTIARNWASEGILTAKLVTEKINELSQKSSEATEILKACGLRRLPSIEEQELFLKWTNEWGFSTEIIKFIAKNLLAKSSKVSFNKLDITLLKYYEMHLFSKQEIEEYERNKMDMFVVAREVCKTIGVYYENLEIVVEKYISSWFALGHTKDSLLMLANYCFKNNIKNLENLDMLILKLYKKGIVSSDAILEYVSTLLKKDNQIKEILSKLGLTRRVTGQDRDFFEIWTNEWVMPQELIDLAIQKSVGKAMPFPYINKLLSTWHSKNITTVQEAEKCSTQEKPVQNNDEIRLAWGRSYKKEDFESLIDDLEDIEL